MFSLPSQVETPFDALSRNPLRDALNAALARLDERSARLLRLRYGLPDGQEHTLQAISDDLGLTRERVRQLEAAALRELRGCDEVTDSLRDFLD